MRITGRRLISLWLPCRRLPRAPFFLSAILILAHGWSRLSRSLALPGIPPAFIGFLGERGSCRAASSAEWRTIMRIAVFFRSTKCMKKHMQYRTFLSGTVMNINIISVQDIRTRLSEIADRAEAGEEFIVTRHSRPAFRIVPAVPDVSPSPSAVREAATTYGEVHGRASRLRSVSVEDAKLNLDRLLAEIEAGHVRYVIRREGRPIADVVPHRTGDRLSVDPELSAVEVNCDLTQPLTEELWED